jgi:TonB-linked SusC/RagA family outer membrane protein
MLFCCSGTYAQATNEIHGIVRDAADKPLSGVSIEIKGTQTVVLSNAQGSYSIQAREGQTLVFSFVGMEKKEVVVGKTTDMDITLTASANSLGEVVVVGYGTVKRADLTGSISTLGKKDLESRVATNPYDVLAAKVPGLNIYNNNGVPGGDISFNIRGFSSINGSNTPLVLVDGVITTNLTGYSPSDFESVSVLKDASATAIYGARGSNGVILITTRKAKSGDFNINYDGNVSRGVAATHIDMLDANGYMELFKRMWEYDPARGSYDAVIKPRLHTDYPLLFDANNNPIYNTDWQKAAERTAISTHQYLSVTQGNEKSKSGLFLGWNNENGIFQSDYQKKYTYRFNSEYYLRSWLTVGGELNGWTVNQQIMGIGGTGGANLARQLLEVPAILPVQFPNGHYTTFRDWGYGTDGLPAQYYPYGNNAVALSNNSLGSAPVKVSDLRVSLNTTIKIMKGLDFKSMYTNETYSNLNYDWGSYTNIDGNGLGSANGSTGRTATWTSDNYLTYDRILGSKHHLTAMLGSQWSSSYTQSLNASSSGYTTDFYQYNNLGVGSQPPVVASAYSSFKTNSYFGRINYIYDEKYLFTLSSRYDGSSVFGTDNKYALFPSGALGWVITKENFFLNSSGLQKIFSFFKLRGTYGLTGNSPAAYSSLGTMGAYTVDLNNQIVKGTGVGTAPNPNLRWEKTAQLDIGADIRMFDDRISLTVDGYSKKTTDLLFNVPVSVVSGYSTVTTNVGSVQNRGIEVMLDGAVVRNKDFGWNLSVLFAKNDNKVLALGTTNADVISSGFLGSSTILRVGKPMGSFIGIQRLGTWGTDEATEAAKYGKKPGDIKRLDVNNDLAFDDKDMQFLGSPFGNYDLTFSTSVRYKNWDLSVDIQVRQGSKIENVAALTIEDRTWYASGYATVLKDAWTPEHQNTMVPALRMAADPWNTDFGSYMDSHWLEDGSFIRGRSLNLNYRLPGAITHKLSLKGLRIYMNMDNFFLIKHNRDFDPEESSFGGGYAGQGQTFYGTPKPRTITFGINANF